MRNRILLNKYFVAITILLILNISLSSCYSLRESGKVDEGVEKYYRVELKNGEIIDFENTRLGFGFRSGDKIVSISKNGNSLEIPLSEIKQNYIKKFDYGNAFFLGVGAVLGVGLILFGIIVIGMDERSVGG